MINVHYISYIHFYAQTHFFLILKSSRFKFSFFYIFLFNIIWNQFSGLNFLADYKMNTGDGIGFIPPEQNPEVTSSTQATITVSSDSKLQE